MKIKKMPNLHYITLLLLSTLCDGPSWICLIMYFSHDELYFASFPFSTMFWCTWVVGVCVCWLCQPYSPVFLSCVSLKNRPCMNYFFFLVHHIVFWWKWMATVCVGRGMSAPMCSYILLHVVISYHELYHFLFSMIMCFGVNGWLLYVLVVAAGQSVMASPCQQSAQW